MCVDGRSNYVNDVKINTFATAYTLNNINRAWAFTGRVEGNWSSIVLSAPCRTCECNALNGVAHPIETVAGVVIVDVSVSGPLLDNAQYVARLSVRMLLHVHCSGIIASNLHNLQLMCVPARFRHTSFLAYDSPFATVFRAHIVAARLSRPSAFSAMAGLWHSLRCSYEPNCMQMGERHGQHGVCAYFLDINFAS